MTREDAIRARLAKATPGPLKPVKAWAVTGPDGLVLPWTARVTHEEVREWCQAYRWRPQRIVRVEIRDLPRTRKKVTR